MDIADGKFEDNGIPKGILDSPHQFDILKQIIHEKYLPPMKFHEFFTIDVELELYNLKNNSSEGILFSKKFFLLTFKVSSSNFATKLLLRSGNFYLSTLSLVCITKSAPKFEFQ